jgi:hypothetical protein
VSHPENYCDEYYDLLGNGSLVSPTKDNRPKHELFGVVAAIRYTRSYKREFIREFESETFIRKRIQMTVQ